LRPAQQTDAKIIYDANRAYKDMENSIWHAANVVLNRAVPDAYKITNMVAMIGQGCNYSANNNPHAMFDTLCV
jgi:hypothetical protein